MTLRPIAWVLLLVAFGASASCAALDSAIAMRESYVHTYRISGQIETGRLGVQPFEGTFQLDQIDLHGVGVETLPATAMTNFQLNIFGGQFGPVANPGTAEFVDGRLNRILVVVSVPSPIEAQSTITPSISSGFSISTSEEVTIPSRAVGFSAGFGPEGVPDDGTGRWVGCLDTQNFIDGWGKYELQEVPRAAP
jgi:hypothetical protein